MRAFFFILILAVIICSFLDPVEDTMDIKTGQSRSLPLSFLKSIPAGENNFSSASQSAQEVSKVAGTGMVKRWIRLNGDGKDMGKLSIADERKIVEKAGIEFRYINIHTVGLQKAAEEIHDALIEGGVMIHCRHGYDRTGAMVGYHLRRMGWRRAEVVQYNNWGWDYVDRKGPKYEFYWHMID